jgi:hypothetical protein
MCTTPEQNQELTRALKESYQASIEAMLSFLEEHDVMPRYIERAFRLPVRTVDEWKKGTFTAGDLALLRLVRTLPALLELADANYKMDREQALTAAEQETLAWIEEDCNGTTVESIDTRKLRREVFQLHTLGLIRKKDGRWWAVKK